MTDIFTENAEAPAAKFEELVGEGKKYRDPDALANAKAHADAHIARLEAEQAEMRAELSARLRVEEMLEKLKPQQEATREIPVTPRQEPGSKEVDISAEVQRLLKSEKEKERRDANIEATRSGLKERFGGDYNQKLEAIASELQVSKEFLTSMAATSPSGFFKLVDSVAAPDKRPVAPPQGSTDTLKFNPNQTRKNHAYYQNLRRTDLNAYMSRKVQNEIHAERVKQGDSFYS